MSEAGHNLLVFQLTLILKVDKTVYLPMRYFVAKKYNYEMVKTRKTAKTNEWRQKKHRIFFVCMPPSFYSLYSL